VGTAPGGEFPLEAIVEKGVQVGVGDEVNGSAGAPVSAVGPATRYELLAAETHGPAPAVAGGHVDVYFVDEQLSR
jgi:hypothetical protein